MLDEEDVTAVLSAALQGGGDFAEVFAERRRSRSVRVDDGRVEELVTGRDVGAGVRVVVGHQSGYAYTNVLTRESLLEAARAAAAAVRRQDRTTMVDLRPAAVPAEPPVRHAARIDPFAADGPALVELVRRAEDAARSVGGDVRQVAVVYADGERSVTVANSEGHRSHEPQVRTRLVVTAMAQRDGRKETGFDGPGAAVGHELFEEHPPELIGRRAAERAVLLLDADPAPSGEMVVVLAGGSGGVLFHEACGHGMEADIVAKGASVYAGRRGDRLGTTLLTGVDDATVPGAWGSFGFDDEGTPAQRTVLFDQGVCTDYLSDRLRAAELGVPRSGNGRRQSYAHLPIPRMTNSYILPGDGDPAEIVREVERGLYCDELGGGQVDTASGDFVFGVSVAHLIEHGEITRPVRGANLVGDGPSVLAAIDAVGSDFGTRQGVCGKDGQHVPAGLGNPTLRIARITVGGTST